MCTLRICVFLPVRHITNWGKKKYVSFLMYSDVCSEEQGGGLEKLKTDLC